MNPEHQRPLDPPVLAALDELKGIILRHHPSASFTVSRGNDEPGNIHLNAVIDSDDPDQVLDLLSDRLVELQTDERIPVYVIPLRTPERILAAMRERAMAGRFPPRTVSLIGGVALG
jgi:hypothetical protein